MGFYSGRDFRFLMEEDEGLEDGVVVDMDDGYSQDLQKIEDNVEPFNVEDVAAAQTGHPNDDEGFDPVEESWQVCYETQYNFNQIMKAIALTECNNAYRGILTESWDDVKGFFTKMKEAFIKMVKKVAAIVKNWIDNITTTFRTNKSFMNKYGNKLGEGLAAIKKTDKKMKGYPFKKALVDGGMKAEVGKKVTDAISTKMHVNLVSGDVKVSEDFTAPSGGIYQNLMSAIYTDIGNSFANGAGVNIAGGDIKSIDDMRKALKKAYYGAEEKKEMWMDVDDIKGVLSKPENCISNAKKSYKEFEKTMNGFISSLKKLEHSAGKDYDAKDKNGKDDPAFGNQSNQASRSRRLNQIRTALSACQDGASAMQIANSTWLAAMRTYAFQARAYANAYVYALNKGDRKNKIDKLDGKTSTTESGLLAGVQFI